ncbi:hypothetical protein PTKU46_47630 [Paraburkholderia terrae]|uniref:O-antigen ligase family protein n=1 Tax=Paraburkholderia terrae TaxID=311230 RepID=UPI00296AC431|nr:O-antigen ligase family protein [Paraburkholderia terrae]MDW3655380.1 O-antigen ligase family protein [Paraburkholderia terrae]
MSILIAIALVLCLPIVPRCWRVYSLLPLAVLQIYPPWLTIGQTPVPLALIVAYAFWPDLLKEAKFLFSNKLIRIILGLSIITLVSFIWSDDLRLGMVSLNSFLAFVVVFAGVTSQARVDHRWIVRGLTAMYIASLGLAASVVAFHFAPTAKILYLNTDLATWFINSNGLKGLFLDGRNNVFDPDKSGGFAFVNANAASTFLGMVSMIALGSSRAYRCPSHFVVTVLLLVAVSFTGSKAGMLLIFPLLAFFFLWKLEKKVRGSVVILVLQGALMLFLFVKIVGFGASSTASPTLNSQISDTADTRFQIWGFAAQMFIRDPILGQGFGGWQIAFPAYARFAGVPTDLPPHNTFIYLWSESGLIAAALGIAFVARLLKRAIYHMSNSDAEAKGLGAMLALTYLWLLVQGFGENQGLIGDVHMQPVLATVLAIFTVRAAAKPAKAAHA